MSTASRGRRTVAFSRPRTARKGQGEVRLWNPVSTTLLTGSDSEGSEVCSCGACLRTDLN